MQKHNTEKKDSLSVKIMTKLDILKSKTKREIQVEATQVLVGRWMDKQDVVHSYNGILFRFKRKEILTHVTT